MPTTAVPKHWKDFRQVGFLSQQVITIAVAESKDVFATHGKMVLCYPAQCDMTNLTPCAHEEAETRLFLIR